MTDIQIEIGDKILKQFIENKGQLHQETYTNNLSKEYPYNQLEFGTIVRMMIDYYGLITRAYNDTNYKILTKQGYDAAGIGLRDYIDNFEREKQLDIDYKRQTIESLRYARKTTSIALKIAIIVPIVTVILQIILTYQINKLSDKKTNRNNNSQIGTNVNLSPFPSNRVNCGFVKIISDSLKNDTAFIKEIVYNLNLNLNTKH
jgi:hypothetical protein